MNHLETKYFSLYKKLDLKLKEKYHTNKGVSEYIDFLETSNRNAKLKLNDYHFLKKLKRCRYLRNQIAHEEEVEINKEDYQVLKEVYKQVSENKEPLYHASYKPLLLIVFSVLIAFFIMFITLLIIRK